MSTWKYMFVLDGGKGDSFDGMLQLEMGDIPVSLEVGTYVEGLPGFVQYDIDTGGSALEVEWKTIDFDKRTVTYCLTPFWEPGLREKLIENEWVVYEKDDN